MIAVIDDDPVIHAILQSILSSRNYTVHCYSNAQDITAICQNSAVQAIFCDINLGSESGFQVLMAAKKAAPMLPFILMSAEHDSSEGEQFPLQPDTFLGKPFTVDQIINLLSTLGITEEG
jgi:DNA-binding NtrC family response regulator